MVGDSCTVVRYHVSSVHVACHHLCKFMATNIIYYIYINTVWLFLKRNPLPRFHEKEHCHYIRGMVSVPFIVVSYLNLVFLLNMSVVTLQ